MELSPEDVLVDENGAPRVRPQDKTVAWVVVLYNPSCMMSRAVAPLIELAAAQSPETRFAAFACGGHGPEKVEFERKGFAAVFEDPICQALEPGFSESPCCVEIKSVGCTRYFFTKSSLGNDAAVLARSSGEEPASPRHRAGMASMAWRMTLRFSTNAP